jgi:hypothetical protein
LVLRSCLGLGDAKVDVEATIVDLTMRLREARGMARQRAGPRRPALRGMPTGGCEDQWKIALEMWNIGR